MKLQTLKFALVFGSFLLVLIIVVSDLCLLGRYECFAGFREIAVSYTHLTLPTKLEV